MSTESHDTGQEPRHTDVSFEERDIKASTIYGYLLALGAAVVASLLVCVYILRFTTNFMSSFDTPPPPSREALGKDYRMLSPEPRLQGIPGYEYDTQADLSKNNKENAENNEKLEWLDKSGGIAQIPVKEAMKIIAEKGLSAAPVQAEKKM
jgi:7-keto-8-aminopelargonate synthetase-like enzyme